MSTLFDHMARESDPDTSHAAASEDRRGLEAAVLDAVRLAGWHGANTDEVCSRLVNDCRLSIRPNSVARRLTSLAKAGLVELAGTRPGESGRSQQVWRSVGHLKGMA